MDHPSIMMRRAVLEEHGIFYDQAFRHVEDYDFFHPHGGGDAFGESAGIFAAYARA